MGVMSMRLGKRETKRIEELAALEHKDKSTVARELLDYGWEFLMIRLYREGKVSLGGLASKLSLTLSETIDRLSELKIEAPLDYDSYVQGLDVLRKKK
jgi:predicted HTH domain antitoxin